MGDLEILLVEDSLADVRLMHEAIREAGARMALTLARDGSEALHYLSNCERGNARRPDLVLLDWHLPVKNGREVLAEIKSSGRLRKIPVLVLTSSAADEDISEAYALNANSFITKPVDLESYVKMVRAIDGFWRTTATLAPNRRRYAPAPSGETQPMCA
jgi:CheY-like chemotaxis protein